MRKLKKEVFVSASILVFLGLVLNITSTWGSDSPVGTILLDKDFETAAVGSFPAGLGFWHKNVVEGSDAWHNPENRVEIVAAPAIGERSVKFADTKGDICQLYGFISGEKNSSLQLDLDWYLNFTVDDNKKALWISLRGENNKYFVLVALGGPGGVSVQQNGKWLDLRVPIKINQWNHLNIIADPPSYGSKGRFSLVVIQGDKKALFENLPFNQPADSYQVTPTLFFGEGDAAGEGKEAYIDNLQVKVIETRKEASAP